MVFSSKENQDKKAIVKELAKAFYFVNSNKILKIDAVSTKRF